MITGELLYVYANPHTKTSMPVPQLLRETMLGFEEGQTVTALETGHWSNLKDKAQPVRTQVFVQEQGIDAKDEWDSADADAVHAVVTNLSGSFGAQNITAVAIEIPRERLENGTNELDFWVLADRRGGQI